MSLFAWVMQFGLVSVFWSVLAFGSVEVFSMDLPR
jgi:hypothetical protein